MKWTDSQQAVIGSEDQSLLVTAAAGSGKTAVLVERIIEKLTDADDPWDISELLVVTFTKAAAKEMKERIYKALDERLQKNPRDARIRRMREKVYSSDIRTIDSFCKNVVSEHFSRIGLDPDFRFMDSGEKELLKRDVIEQMMRDEYEKGKEDFLALSDMFSSKGSDDALTAIILDIYDKAQAYAWPHRFYSSLMESIAEVDADTVADCSWMKSLVAWVKDYAGETVTEVGRLIRIASAQNDNGVFDTIITNLSADEGFFKALSEAEDYNTIHSLADTYRFARVGRQQAAKGTEEEKGIADAIKVRRDEYKSFFNEKMKEKFLYSSTEIIAEEENAKVPVLREIIRLAEEFDDAYLAEKTDRKSFEFSDVEHFAVRILMNEDGTITDAAENYRKRYREVMVDEYQDTNELNEMILSAVTRDRTNYFMVGDVKQSIYGFRNADPGIIIGKSDTYEKRDDAQFRRIDLDRNFRSRKCVTDTVNDIFRLVMIPEIGGVIYDESAELKFGADYYPEIPEGQDNATETVVLLRDDDELNEISDDNMSLEATWIAQKIQSMMKGFMVADGKGGMRPLQYQDIAVTLRSTKVNAAKIMEVFNAYGIPAENAADTGYFSAPEVVAALNYLRIIDNPRQDIPLTSILTSMFYGFSDEDLALIRTAHEDMSFHEAVLAERDDPKAALSEGARKRLNDFFTELAKLRERASDTPVYEVLAELFSDTGYDLLVSCLPGGDRRRENLMKLIDKACAFTRTSYSGIASFVSYIERLGQYNADEGEADTGNGGDAVRIMTIHKSKGLEFPVVFAVGLGKKFIKTSTSVEIGAGGNDISMPLIDTARHSRKETVHLAMLRSWKDDSELGEELRVLYVALTRAKEKLILVGCLSEKDRDSLMEKGRNISTDRLSYSALKGAGSFYKVILPALVKNGYVIQSPDASDFVENEAEAAKEREDIRTLLNSEGSASVKDRALKLYERFTHPYAYEREVIPKQKYSVSEIKKAAIEAELREEAEDMIQSETSDEEFTPTVPAFLNHEAPVKNKSVLGTERGTAMHRFLEKLDFSRTPLSESLEEQISEEVDKGFLTTDQEQILKRKQLAAFLSTDLAHRMQEADRNGELYREQAFVAGDTPEFFFGDLTDDTDGVSSEDQIIIQGIIDAFFVENGKIVLLDYKTDKVRTEGELLQKYKKQLQLYQIAVERGMNLPVSEMYLYSFALGKQVAVPLVSH